MRCFEVVFRHCLRGLGGLGDSGGLGRFGRAESRSFGDPILRQADADIPIVRGSQAPGGVVVGSRLASIYLEPPESAPPCTHNWRPHSRTRSIHDTRRKTDAVVAIRSLTISLRLRPAVNRLGTGPTRQNPMEPMTWPHVKRNHADSEDKHREHILAAVVPFEFIRHARNVATPRNRPRRVP